MTEHKKNNSTHVAEATNVRTDPRNLSPLEEKVVRMVHGWTAPDDMPLEHVGQNNPELAAQLAAMEKRALAAVGARTSDTKRKIVNSLRKKTQKLPR